MVRESNCIWITSHLLWLWPRRVRRASGEDGQLAAFAFAYNGGWEAAGVRGGRAGGSARFCRG